MVLATAVFATTLIVGGIALHGATIFDLQFGARYIVVSINQVLLWLAFGDCVVSRPPLTFAVAVNSGNLKRNNFGST